MQNSNLNAVATEPVRQTEVSEQLSRIEELTQHIGKITDELEMVLSRSILAQHKSENAVGGASAPEPIRVPLAQTLFDHAANLGSIRERLDSVLSRLEA